jgi:NADPH:quinone reductase-like Zn-dependent oxidoreductase
VRGERVFFMMPEPPFGSMAQKTLVRAEYCVPVPYGVDDVIAAAIGNPGMSSLAALRYRAAFKRGETVLVNGATGTAGALAVQLAKILGAKKVIATGRNPAGLERAVRLGADATIDLTLEPEALSAAFARELAGEGIDIVLDYLFGTFAELLLTAIGRSENGGKPLRYVEIGNAAGKQIALSGWILRAVPVTIMGSGLGSVPTKDLIDAAGDAMRALTPNQLDIAATGVPLANVAKIWNDAPESRIVFTIP